MTINMHMTMPMTMNILVLFSVHPSLPHIAPFYLSYAHTYICAHPFPIFLFLLSSSCFHSQSLVSIIVSLYVSLFIFPSLCFYLSLSLTLSHSLSLTLIDSPFLSPPSPPLSLSLSLSLSHTLSVSIFFQLTSLSLSLYNPILPCSRFIFFYLSSFPSVLIYLLFVFYFPLPSFPPSSSSSSSSSLQDCFHSL